MRAFFFSRDDCKLVYGDDTLCRTGRTHKIKGELRLWSNGLHASVHVMDALMYASGTRLWVVELGGTIINDDDKMCATERKYIASFNASKVLRQFARIQASINVDKIKKYCNDDGFSIIHQWLLTGDESLMEEARNTAIDAAWSAAESAIYSLADATARSDSCHAAESVIRSATCFVTYCATYPANDPAARKMLYEMLPERIKRAYTQ